MSPIQIFSLVLLLLSFAVAIYRRVNVGVVVIPAGFLLSLVAGIPVAKFYTYFPGSLVILILGVSFLFGHAQRSGVVDRITDLAVRATGGRAWLLPWIMFIVAAVLSSIGALPAAALAIVVPLAMRTAVRHNINLMLMGIVTIEGALAGGFSPISVWGQVVATVTAKASRSLSEQGLFGLEFGLNLLVAIVAFGVFGGLRLMRRDSQPIVGLDRTEPADRAGGGAGQVLSPRAPHRPVATQRPEQAMAAVAEPDLTAAGPKQSRLNTYEIASLVAIAAFVVVVLVLHSDVGLTAFAAGLVLQVIFRPEENTVNRALPWSVVLLISGVMLYVGLLDKLGTLDAIASHLQDITSLSVAILAISFVGSLFASFESSSVAVLGLIIPLVLRVVPGVHGIGLLMVMSAVCWSIVVVSTSPYHLSGGLVLASSPQQDQAGLFRRLLLWSLAVALAIPVAGWVLPSVVSS